MTGSPRDYFRIYLEDRSLSSLMRELPSVKRKPGENLTELVIRIEGIVEKLENVKPGGKEVHDYMFLSIFLNALPKDSSFFFSFCIHFTGGRSGKKTVYKKSLKHVASHPSLQLTDASVRKENQGITVNSVSVPKSTAVTHQSTIRKMLPRQRCV